MLLDHPSFSTVKVFVRRKTGLVHSRLQEIVVDFEDSASMEKHFEGDVVFCCLGTTINAAGSKQAFEKVDLHYPSEIAGIASRKGIKMFLMISSVGADKRASGFYLRTKGRAEANVSGAGIPSVIIFRPSMLLGKRKEFRFGELIGKFFMRAFSMLFIGKWKRYRPVPAYKVAQAMIFFSIHPVAGIRIVENEEILGAGFS